MLLSTIQTDLMAASRYTFGENSRLCRKPHNAHLLIYLNRNFINGILTKYLLFGTNAITP